jgi:two-component system alkaline phosphatase synthesis response regulator PhoP
MKKILLVEDDPFILDIYNKKFTGAGFSVDVATDGQMALEKVKNSIPDLVVLDILLPKMDGWEVLRQMRQQAPLKNLKVIVLSNLNSDDFQDKIKTFNVSKYLLKIETTPEEIVNTINAII